MIGVVAHQSGQIEGCGESGLALREEIAEALVGIFGRAEARELPHRPKPAAVHGGMNSAGVRRLAREAEIVLGVPIRQIRFRVQAANRIPGNGGEFGLSFGAFFQRRMKRVFLPGLFLGGGRSIY